MSFGTRLAEALKGAGMTSNALSLRLGMSSTGVWNWMHDNTQPRPETLARVADILGVTSDWLLGEDASPEPAQVRHSALARIAEAKASIAHSLGLPPERISLEVRILA